MKKLILPIILAPAFIIGINAGTRCSIKSMSDRGHNVSLAYFIKAGTDSLLTIDEIKANVNLTDSQSITVDSILTDAAAKLQGVTDSGDSGQQAKSQIIDNAYSSIRNMLTDDQRTKFDALVAMKKGNSGGNSNY